MTYNRHMGAPGQGCSREKTINVYIQYRNIQSNLSGKYCSLCAREAIEHAQHMSNNGMNYKVIYHRPIE